MRLKPFNINYQSLLLLLLVILIFWILGFIPLDPDFGYKLTNGQLILQSGIPNSDPYSYTMPSYHFVEHSWLSVVLVAILYRLVGKPGLALIFSLIAFMALYVAFSAGSDLQGKDRVRVKLPFFLERWVFGSSIFLLVTAVIIPFFGIRVQVFSWLFLAITIKILLSEKVFNKYRLFLPFLFLFWANMHGSFLEGIVLLFLVILVQGVVNKKFDPINLLVLFFSVLATLLNPYGIGLWEKVLIVASNNSLRWRIAEWAPAFVWLNIPFVFVISLSFALLFKYWQKNKVGVVLFIVTFFQALLGVRHVPLWALVTMPVLIKAIYFFFLDVKSVKFGLQRFQTFYRFLWTLSFVLLIASFGFLVWRVRALSEDEYYPKKAIEYLRSDLPDGQILSLYEWGGYLSWQFPEKRVFINGQMPVWQRDEEVAGESKNAFEEYNRLLSGKVSYQEIFEKYGINTVLWVSRKEENSGSILESWLTTHVAWVRDKNTDFDIVASLEKDGWSEVYRDSVAVVYQKPS